MMPISPSFLDYSGQPATQLMLSGAELIISPTPAIGMKYEVLAFKIGRARKLSRPGHGQLPQPLTNGNSQACSCATARLSIQLSRLPGAGRIP